MAFLSKYFVYLCNFYYTNAIKATDSLVIDSMVPKIFHVGPLIWRCRVRLDFLIDVSKCRYLIVKFHIRNPQVVRVTSDRKGDATWLEDNCWKTVAGKR